MSKRSPKKARPTTATQLQTSVYEVDAQYQEHIHSSQMTISNQEIEIERLKTTVIALNAKCAIVDDHRTDVENTTIRHSESERIRGDLHSHITATGEKVKNDNIAHTDYQDELQQNLGDLNTQLENEK